ncbi:hypothetical protein MHUMG1_10374 [Metarhizium humberi]|uniref:Uncharacterized protein n=1 Tax=Metarhizium humberi TaxID=2596975 RepID=A0A9P8M1D7_9HYPO|nr:hypothetical protein MHUMG1_10374 [Metarhizium humberi]
MPLSPPRRQQLAQEYGIGLKPKEKWPKCYESLFRNVQRLGDKRLDDWENESGDNCRYGLDHSNWRQRTKSRVELLARRAEGLRGSWREASEADWRRLEEIIFEHLDHDVNCSKYESSILGVRKEAPITYDKALKRAMDKKNEKPDLFYGLLQTGRVLKYMRGLTKTSAVRTTPFVRKDTKCVFPFLISEAKSEKAGVSQSEIELQICFAARETLLAQQSLASATNTGRLAFEPLVWCVTYRGETIDITAACLHWKDGEGDEGAYGTDLMRIWSGNLSSQDGALGCLFIMDYIADWARDVYRENVIKELKSIARTTYKSAVPVSPTITVVSHDEDDADDDDVPPLALSCTTVNLRTLALPQMQSSTEQDSSSSSDGSSRNWALLESPSRRRNVRLVPARVHHGTTAAPVDRMREFDVATCAYRDARYIRSRVMGLCITSESVQDLFNSRTQRSAETLFSRIAVQLEKHQLAEMKGSTLVAMEQAWSGINNGKAHVPFGAESFYVSFTFSAYLSPDWEQTRELCYIAVSKNALDIIKRPIVREGENRARSYLRLGSTLCEQTKPKHATRQQNSSPWMPCILEEEEQLVLCHDENPGGLHQEQRPEWCLFWVHSDQVEHSKWRSILEKLRLAFICKTSRLGVGKHWQKIKWNESNLETAGFDSKVASENCLDALFSALAQDKRGNSSRHQETGIEHALSQLQIYSKASTPRQTCGKPVNQVHVEELDNENSDSKYESPENRATNLRSGYSSEDYDSLNDSGDEVLVEEENQGRSTDLYRPRYHPRGLLTMDYYRKKRNAA